MSFVPDTTAQPGKPRHHYRSARGGWSRPSCPVLEM